MEIDGFQGPARWFSRDDDGHFYVACRTRGASSSMRCASNRCPAHWTLNNGQPGPLIGEHDHEPTPWVRNRNTMYQALKRRCRTEVVSLNAIFEEEAARYPDAAPHLLYESLESSMRKWRRSQQPAVPHTLPAYGAALAEHPRHSDMLLATVSAGAASAVILVMPGFGQCLRECDTLIADGTFHTVPAGLPAYQILTVHTVIRGRFFHPVFVLMENRRRVLYEAVFRRIWQAAGNPRPTHIVTDFERALQAALESVTNIPVQGCLFHFVQALLRRARQEGIAVGRNSPGWKLVQLYGALALLPAARVPLGLAEVLHIAAHDGLPASPAFHQYFLNQWMTRVGAENFSVHGSPHRTSNVAESFHAALGRSLGAEPNIWRFTDVAAQKFAVTASRFEAQNAGDPPRRNREQHYIRAAILLGNERALDRGLITLREFLVATSRHMDVGVGVIVDDVPDVEQEVIIDDAAVLEPEVVIDEAPQEPIHVPEQAQPARNPAPMPIAQPFLCGVCVENTPAYALNTCGHLLCADCLEGVNNSDTPDRCPFCRTNILSSLRIFPA